MGIYVYTMRKRTVNIIVDGMPIKANLFSYAYKDSWALKLGREAAMRKRTVNIIVDGMPIKANLFSYAYKDSWALKLGREAARWDFKVANAERVGNGAFNSPRSGFIVLGDAKDDKHGATVYKGVTSGVWVDVNEFPGTPAGYLHREGKRLVLRPDSPWSAWMMGEAYEKIRYIVAADGSVTTEQEPITQETYKAMNQRNTA